jgi:hypothetical protein
VERFPQHDFRVAAAYGLKPAAGSPETHAGGGWGLGEGIAQLKDRSLARQRRDAVAALKISEGLTEAVDQIEVGAGGVTIELRE